MLLLQRNLLRSTACYLPHFLIHILSRKTCLNNTDNVIQHAKDDTLTGHFKRRTFNAVRAREHIFILLRPTGHINAPREQNAEPPTVLQRD